MHLAAHSYESSLGQFGQLGTAMFVTHQHPKEHQFEQTGSHAGRVVASPDHMQDRFFFWLQKRS